MRLDAVLAAAFLVSSCAQAKPIDFAAPETWLGPDEAKAGRKLSFVGRSGIYIGTANGCVLPKSYKIDGSLDTSRWDPAWQDVQSLFYGSQSSGDPAPGPPLMESIPLAIEYHYPPSLNAAEIRYNSAYCQEQRGTLSPQFRDHLVGVPSNISIFVHRQGFDGEKIDETIYEVSESTFILRRLQRNYCKISLGIIDEGIRQVRIDVLTSANVVPQFSDAEAMDCIARGMFASVGYLGILRYEFDELYKERDLPKRGKPNRNYITPLLVGFEQYIIENRMPK